MRESRLASEGDACRHGVSTHVPSSKPSLFKPALRPDSLRLFYRSLATLLLAGVRVDRALALLGHQEDDPHMAQICRKMCVTVTHGHALSEAMAQWPRAFSELDQKLVQVGEMTGNMDQLLERLATYEENRRAVTMRVRSALTYPLFIFLLTLAALVVLPPYLFAGLFRLIESLGVDVPLLTRIVLIFAKVMSNPFFLVAAGLGVLAAVKLLPGFLERPAVRLRLAHIGLRLPVLGKALQTIAVTRFARALEIMINCGVSLDECLKMAFVASGNPVLAERRNDALETLFSGVTLYDVLKETEFFPSAFLQVVSVGEESGRLPELLSRICDMYDVQLAHTLETVVAALEPAMMVMMGSFVGVFIIASMQPMSQILQKL